jgi:hypothetical protein
MNIKGGLYSAVESVPNFLDLGPEKLIALLLKRRFSVITSDRKLRILSTSSDGKLRCKFSNEAAYLKEKRWVVFAVTIVDEYRIYSAVLASIGYGGVDLIREEIEKTSSTTCAKSRERVGWA